MTVPPPPERSHLDAAFRALEPLRRLLDPHVDGWGHVPTDPATPLLLVGNHTVGGIFDVPHLVAAFWGRTGRPVRALGDHAHFRIPGWRALLLRLGVVEGTPDGCAALLESGQVVLVFPGGAREVTKDRSERYQLLWRGRKGFARLACRTGATVVPFAAVGVEDALDWVIDRSDLAATPLGPWLDALPRQDLRMPWIRGFAGTPLPKPERLYFRFMPAIRPAGDGDAAVDAVRDAARAAIEQGISELRAFRSEDPRRTLEGRLMPRRTRKNGPLWS